MSFILDALRKSEIERQRQSGPSMAEFPVARADRRLPVALIAIGFLLAVNVGVVLYFMLRESPAIVAAATPVPAPAATTASVANALPATVSPAPGGSTTLFDDLAGQPVPEFDEMATEPPDPPDPMLIPDAPTGMPGVVYSEAPPTSIEKLGEAGVGGLPELSVDLHIYADDPAKRAVFINGRRYVQGARILEGPVVEEITADGAVLSYHGRRFLLPRL